jgi:hypothetical protein
MNISQPAEVLAVDGAETVDGFIRPTSDDLANPNASRFVPTRDTHA